jgi:hypothetical protein
MGWFRELSSQRGPALAISIAAVALGCASAPTVQRFELFGDVPEGDVFGSAIQRWQASTQLESLRIEIAALREEMGQKPPRLDDIEPNSPLGRAYASFTSELRHQLVLDTLSWVQLRSGLYYWPDGKVDEWPILREVLDRGGDDCDGMDLLTFSLLRRLGFGNGEIYRAIVRNRETDAHHMVTLWFETGREHDPWLLDSTGEITSRVLPLSFHSDWEPVRLFDEQSAYAASVEASAR